MNTLIQLLQQAEGLINRGETAVALGLIGIAKKEAAQETNDEPKDTIPDRIEEQRGALFRIQAALGIATRSLKDDSDCDLRRVLSDAYGALDEIAHQLDLIETDVRQAAGPIAVPAQS